MHVTCSHSSSSILHKARLCQHFPPLSKEQPLLDPSLPGIGNGLPADWGDELDREGFLLGVDVSVICRDKDMSHMNALEISLIFDFFTFFFLLKGNHLRWDFCMSFLNGQTDNMDIGTQVLQGPLGANPQKATLTQLKTCPQRAWVTSSVPLCCWKSSL